MMSYLPVFIIYLVLILSGCEQQPPPAPTAAAAEVAQAPPYLRIPLDGAISTLDPGLAQFIDAIELTEHLFLGLTDFDPKRYEAIAELAKNWSSNEAGTVYEFELNRGVKWSDGSLVTAEDVAWAIQRNLKLETKSPYINMLYILKNAKAFREGEIDDPSQLGVQVKSKYLLKFTLENAAGYFPALVGLPVFRPLPRKAIEQHGNAWTEPGNIVTNGSYKVKGWQKGSILELEKNPGYYDADNVRIDMVKYYIVPESSLGLSMYESNELDILGEAYLRIPLSELPRVRRNSLLLRELHKTPNFCTEIYGFNTTEFPTDNPLVRKALVAAVNKSLLLNFVLKGEHEIATTFTRPPIFGAVENGEGVGISFNPKQAKAWLAEAGYPEGENFPELVLVHNISETHNDIANALKTMFRHYLNIELTVKALDFDSYVDSIFEPAGVHLFRIGWCTDYPDANNWLHEAFHPTEGANFIRWNHEEYGRLTKKAQTSSDLEERRQLYLRAEQILNWEEAGILPLYFSTATYLVKPRVKEWYSMAFGGQHVRDWALETP